MYLYHLFFFLLLLSAVVCGLLATRRPSELPYRLLSWLMIATFPMEISAYFIGHYYHRNHWLYNAWAPLECGTVMLVFYLGVSHRMTRRINGWLLALLPVGTIVCYYFHHDVLTLNVREMLYCLFCELISACVLLSDSLLGGDETSIYRKPLSWMAFGTIISCCVFILLHALWRYILVWPIWRYGTMVVVANTFYYTGAIFTFLSLQKNRRDKKFTA